MQLFDLKTKIKDTILQHVAFNKLEKETHTYKKDRNAKKKNHSYPPPLLSLAFEDSYQPKGLKT